MQQMCILIVLSLAQVLRQVDAMCFCHLGQEPPALLLTAAGAAAAPAAVDKHVNMNNKHTLDVVQPRKVNPHACQSASKTTP
jgi:hypothetical protein